MGLIRRTALEAIGGWDETCITEDAEASLRMLGRGWSVIYVPTAAGTGIMPLTLDGLKEAALPLGLGGIQILRRHCKDRIGLGKLRREWSPRAHYLLGGLHWFGDLFQVFLTTLLLATAVAVSLHRASIGGYTPEIWALREAPRQVSRLVLPVPRIIRDRNRLGASRAPRLPRRGIK